MTMQPLSDNSPLSQEVLPAVWVGYKCPSCQPITVALDQTSQAIQSGFHFSKEEADKISNCFWTESIHDFCVQYLGGKLTDEDHAKILKTANEFIKNGTTIRIDKKETDITKLLAAKIVLNAHQRANHAMANACFLWEVNMLPKENIFMLQKGISPVFYEKDEFERSEMLKDKAYGAPEDRLSRAFTNWFHRAGMRYIPAFNQMRELVRDIRHMIIPILEISMKSHTKEKRIARRRHRTRRCCWRSREG